MSESAGHASEDAERLHRIIAEGDLDALQAALNDGAEVNAPGRMGMTAVMIALDLKDLEKVRLLIQHGADPEQTDQFNTTALRHAVQRDFAEGVRFLLGLGVDRGLQPRHPLKTIDYGPLARDLEMPDAVKEFMSEEEWKTSLEETSRQVHELGQNPTIEPMICEVQSVEVLKLFLEAGEDLTLAPTEIRRALVGLPTGGELRVSVRDYRAAKTRRFGRRNPEPMDVPF